MSDADAVALVEAWGKQPGIARLLNRFDKSSHIRPRRVVASSLAAKHIGSVLHCPVGQQGTISGVKHHLDPATGSPVITITTEQMALTYEAIALIDYLPAQPAVEAVTEPLPPT